MSKSVGNVVDPFDLVESLRPRPGALLFPARSDVRAGRQLHARSDRQPHQRRSRQQPRQPGAALAVDDLQELRRRHSERRGRSRGGHRRFSMQPTRSCDSARRDGPADVTQYLDAVWSVVADANRYFAAEEPWAKKKDRPGAHGDDPLRHRRMRSPVRNSRQPVMPERAGEAARPAWPFRRTRALLRALARRAA